MASFSAARLTYGGRTRRRLASATGCVIDRLARHFATTAIDKPVARQSETGQQGLTVDSYSKAPPSALLAPPLGWPWSGRSGLGPRRPRPSVAPLRACVRACVRAWRFGAALPLGPLSPRGRSVGIGDRGPENAAFAVRTLRTGRRGIPSPQFKCLVPHGSRVAAGVSFAGRSQSPTAAATTTPSAP